MITHKQYPNHHVYEMEIGGRPFTVETGKVAELANAECICRYGDTVVVREDIRFSLAWSRKKIFPTMPTKI